MQRALPIDGVCSGPLFAPARKTRLPKPKARGWRWFYRRNERARPAWATNWKIDLLYAIAKARKLSVDHIVPISHTLVCGLHVEHNLQLLTLEENQRKGNSYWPDMWEIQGELF